MGAQNGGFENALSTWRKPENPLKIPWFLCQGVFRQLWCIFKALLPWKMLENCLKKPWKKSWFAIPAAIYRSAFRARAWKCPRSAFWAILGTCLGVPQRVLFECFLAFLGPKHAKKHSKSTLWGTPRQVPKIAQKALRGALSGPGPKSTCKWRPGSQNLSLLGTEKNHDNQKKGQNEKFMNFALFCEFWCFFLGKTSTIHMELLFGNAPAKSSWSDLSLVWFAGATPEKNSWFKNQGIFRAFSNPPFCAPTLRHPLRPSNFATHGKAGPRTLNVPKGPRHTKNCTRSEFAIRSELTTRSDSLLKM